jgi:hypothetical protein
MIAGRLRECLKNAEVERTGSGKRSAAITDDHRHERS